jgi:WD40 repeat protein
MLLKYAAFLELDTGHISSLDFSLSGRVLAVVNTVGEISLWDTKTGTRYNPVLSAGAAISGSSSTLWIDENILVCGLSDGSLTTCNLLNGNLPMCDSKLFVGSLRYC